MIWFDLDNSPHVPLFRPILKELGRRNCAVEVTARDFAQTSSLLKFWEIPHTLIGKHAGKNKIKKLLNVITRSCMLLDHIKGKEISLAVSHGSRTQVMAAWRAGIPSVVMMDYEHTESWIFNTFSTYLLMPEYIPIPLLKSIGFNVRKLIQYPGFKEEIYLQDFVPNEQFRKEIGVREDEILVTVRPPSVVGNYHEKRSESLLVDLIDHISETENSRCLIVSRFMSDANLIPQSLRGRKNVTFLEKAVDGLQLLWASDVVISGGGTMNREAALLGVPTYSFFTGKKPYLDFYLEEKGKMRFISDRKSIGQIPIERWQRPGRYHGASRQLAEHVTGMILELTRKNG